MSVSVPIRTIAELDRAAWEADCDVEGARAALADHRDRVLAAERERIGHGRTLSKSRRATIADSDHGRLTNTYALGHALAEEDRLRNALRDALSRRSDVRFEQRMWRERIPVGMLEIAELLGYGPDAPRQWKRRNVLPAAAGTVSGTPYWWRPDVLRWALTHGRTRAFIADSWDDDWTNDSDEEVGTEAA